MLILSRNVLLHVFQRLWMVFVSHGCPALLLMDRAQCRCLDEDPPILHRLKIHVQARDWLVGQANIPRHPRLHRAAHHPADLRQLPILQ